MNHHSPDKNYIIALEEYDATAVTFGEASFTQLTEYFLQNNVSVALFVLGGTGACMNSGAYQAFVNMTSGFDLETPIVQGIPPEPAIDDVQRIIDMMEKVKPQEVVALGGGSVMDAAKAAYLSWQSGMSVRELYGSGKASAKFPGREFKRIIAFPTTSGTGSEVTPYSNIVDPEKQVKRLICDFQMIPSQAFVDSSFTMSMPPELTRTTALDAMVHSIESLLNVNPPASADPRTDSWAVEAVKLIHYALPKVLENPDDPLAREMLSAAAVFGGMCIKNKPTSLPHLCSFSLYGKVPHGLAVAAFLPVFWKYYLGEEKVADATMKLAGIFDSETGQNTPADVVSAAAEFLAKYSGIGRLKDIPGFDDDLMEKIASDALKNPVKLESAPRKILPEQAHDVILALLKENA